MTGFQSKRLMNAQSYTVVERRSVLSGKVHSIAIPLSPDDFDECMFDWRNGRLLQDAFPTLTADQREFIKTGVTQEEWYSLLGVE
jgi:hypothetical protein